MFNKIKNFILVLSFLGIGYNSNAQQNNADRKTGNPHWCHTDLHYQNLVKENPEIELARQLNDQRINQLIESGNFQIERKNSSSTIVIPVVFHVTHECGGERLTKAQIEASLLAINKDLKRINSDTGNTRAIFKPVAAAMDIELRLAKIDPSGNCTEGITYRYTTATNDAGDNIKSSTTGGVTAWNTSKYFNIWTVKSIAGGGGGGTILGYAQFPGGGSWNTYGIVVRYDELGRTLTHELGHCLNLYHTFQSGCGGNCLSSGDQVCDTPPSTEATYGCSQSQNTCSNDATGAGSGCNTNPFTTNVVDQIENYMSYDACQNMFTNGQKCRFLAAFSSLSQLQNLVSNGNLIETGTNDGYNPVRCAPKAEFCYDKSISKNICKGGVVNYSDASYNDQADSTWAYLWSFPGGNPSSSTEPNPTVIYDTTGTFSATLNVSNGVGSNSITKTNVLTVNVSPGLVNSPIFEGLENPAFPNISSNSNENWVIKTGGSSNTWERTTAAAVTDNASARIRLGTIASGQVHTLTTPVLNLSTATSASKIYFKVAYSRRNATGTGSDDRLRVLFSTNCGETWIQRYSKSGATLSTIGTAVTSSGTFVPTSSQWRQENMALTGMFGKPAVMLMFEVTSNQGNALYLEDINITTNNADPALGINEFKEVSINNFEVYPNPFTTDATIDYTILKSGNVNLEIIDAIGKTYQVINKYQQEGDYSINIADYVNLSNGFYTVRLTTNDDLQIRKIIKE